jgi:alpha 1,2-mannosyltransferase
MPYSHIQALTNTTVQFGVIPSDHWHQPSWVDEDRASKSRDEMVRNNVIYGGTCWQFQAQRRACGLTIS